MRKKSARSIFGERVRELRQKRGWTQSELAKRASISERYLQRIEGKEPPDATLDVIAKLARGFNLSCWQMVD